MLAPRAKLTKLVVQLLCSVVAGLLAVLITVPLLGPGWHLLFGDTISFEGWRVPVPQGFYVRQSATETAMWKQSFGIPFFNVPYGHVSLYRSPQKLFSLDRDYSRFKAALAQDASKEGYKLTSERTVPVGDKPAHCLEFKRSSPAPGALVRCVVESSAIAIFYEGDPRYVPDVFAILQGVSTNSRSVTCPISLRRGSHDV